MPDLMRSMLMGETGPDEGLESAGFIVISVLNYSFFICSCYYNYEAPPCLDFDWFCYDWRVV